MAFTHFATRLYCKPSNSRHRNANAHYPRRIPAPEYRPAPVGAFDVPVDYLLGEGKHASYNNDTIKRIEEIQVLDGNTKSILFNLIDTYIRDAKARKAYA